MFYEVGGRAAEDYPIHMQRELMYSRMVSGDRQQAMDKRSALMRERRRSASTGLDVTVHRRIS